MLQVIWMQTKTRKVLCFLFLLCSGKGVAQATVQSGTCKSKLQSVWAWKTQCRGLNHHAEWDLLVQAATKGEKEPTNATIDMDANKERK